jgi:citrate lyase beta subunit
MNHRNFEIHHFIPLTHYRAAASELSTLVQKGIFPVLDLEDSVQCVFDPVRNLRLKNLARQGLLSLAELRSKEPIPQDKLMIRINHRATSHYKADLEAIARCYEVGFCPSIVLPKVESCDDLQHCSDWIQSKTGITPRIIPIIAGRLV